MIKGADISYLSQNELFNGHYYMDGKEEDCLKILVDKGINLFRLRLFVDPYDENHESYGAGISDLSDVIQMARRIKKLGCEWYLVFHYSDCWADPGKQILPKGWRNQMGELVKTLYEYTKTVMIRLKEEGLLPSIVSIGNEITNGLCWPYGKAPNFKNIVSLVNAGIKAVKEVSPGVRVMIHLDNGGNNELYRNWFLAYLKEGGEDFDVLGLSYYPLWHGSFDNLKDNMADMASLLNKDLLVAETSYPFSTESYLCYEGLSDKESKGPAARKELLKNLPFPVSEDGQAAFLSALMDICAQNEKCLGLVYWGGECIPVKGVGWASKSAIAYMKESGPGGNEWANQALFDYQGNALKALDILKNY